MSSTEQTNEHPEGAGRAVLHPPVASRRPQVVEAHGDSRTDDYAWLRDSENPEVIEHLRAENAYTESAIAHLSGLRERLFEEIKSRIEETDLSVPVRKGPWWYLTRTVEGLSYPIHCRVPVDGPGREPGVPPMPADDDLAPVPWPDEQVLLDENVLAEGHEYLALGVLDVSPDHRLLAYAIDTAGDERFTLRFKDLSTGADMADEITDVSYGSAWASDDATFFYVRADAAHRPHQVWKHRLGADPATDNVMFEEADERFHVGVRRTKDGQLVICSSHSKLSSEIHILAAGRPDDELSVVEPRRDDIEYEIEHHRGFLLMLTNEEAPNFRLLASRAYATAEKQAATRWVEVIAHRPEARLEGIEVFDDFLVCAERTEGMPHGTRPPDRRAARRRGLEGSAERRLFGAGRRGAICELDRAQPRAIVEGASLRVLVHGDSSDRARHGPDQPGECRPQTSARARRIRPGALRERTSLGHGARLDPGAHICASQARHTPGRICSLPPLRIRRLRGLHRSGVLISAAVAR